MSEKPYKDFLCEYPFAGSRWSFTIKAQSFEDADERLKAMCFAQVNGEVMLDVKVAPHWFGRLFERRHAPR